jgi:hypothetical protein
MAQATATQIQKFADERVRVRAEQLRAVILGMRDDKIAIDDVYAALVDSESAWTDARTDGPPRLLDAQAILTYNTGIDALLAVIDGVADAGQIANLHGALTVVLSACVRPPV